MFCCLIFRSPFFSLSERQHNNDPQMCLTLKSLICVFIRTHFPHPPQCESHYDIENLFAGIAKINRFIFFMLGPQIHHRNMCTFHRSYHIKEWFVLPVCRHSTSFAYLLRSVFKAVFRFSFIDLHVMRCFFGVFYATVNLSVAVVKCKCRSTLFAKHSLQHKCKFNKFAFFLRRFKYIWINLKNKSFIVPLFVLYIHTHSKCRWLRRAEGGCVWERKRTRGIDLARI